MRLIEPKAAPLLLGLLHFIRANRHRMGTGYGEDMDCLFNTHILFPMVISGVDQQFVIFCHFLFSLFFILVFSSSHCLSFVSLFFLSFFRSHGNKLKRRQPHLWPALCTDYLRIRWNLKHRKRIKGGHPVEVIAACRLSTIHYIISMDHKCSSC